MNTESILLRQINPSFLRHGIPTAQAFMPTRKDSRRLSMYDGDQIAPRNAWKHFTEQLGLVSSGVQGVTVGECHSLNLRVSADPEPFPEHVVIEFPAMSRRQSELTAKALVDAAKRRGWLFQPEFES
ncbi:hypothetical protein K8I61_03710 [bacterium]|nr:hypothetical protein [bacterium]